MLISSCSRSLNTCFVSSSVRIRSQSMTVDCRCSLLNLIEVNLNFDIIAEWSLLTPNFVTLQSLIRLKNWSQQTKLSNMCGDFSSLNDRYVTKLLCLKYDKRIFRLLVLYKYNNSRPLIFRLFIPCGPKVLQNRFDAVPTLQLTSAPKRISEFLGRLDINWSSSS